MEDFVPFEIAKKLKEKWFPQHITKDAYIIDNYGENEYQIGDRLPIPLIPDYMDDIAAPTISQVLKWLREEKKIYIMVDRSFSVKGWHYYIIDNDDFENPIQQEVEHNRCYEQAAIDAIEYVLDNLI